MQPERIVSKANRACAQSGRAVTGNLLRCFVRREETPRHGLGAARYCLYLGAAHMPGAAPPKFLLAALQTSRCRGSFQMPFQFQSTAAAFR